MDWAVCSGDTIRLSIGHERAAACSAVKATRFAGDPNKFGSALIQKSLCLTDTHVNQLSKHG